MSTALLSRVPFMLLCASLTLACSDKDEGDSAGGLSPGDFLGKCGAHCEYILTTATGCESEMLDEYHSSCVGDCAVYDNAYTDECKVVRAEFYRCASNQGIQYQCYEGGLEPITTAEGCTTEQADAICCQDLAS